MLAHAIEDGELDALDPSEFLGEWKWDGIRVQAVAGVRRARPASHRASIPAPARTFRGASPT